MRPSYVFFGKKGDAHVVFGTNMLCIEIDEQVAKLTLSPSPVG